ncbi:hypothetical protein [Pedobacter nototheniae]|uniref:hypothetical protein n=1 Tax=Pedobacter nototheniae TaxID=2488994 RepID=UPI00292D4859|nr:hypothetical protein [Pedobacter nototheniae]
MKFKSLLGLSMALLCLAACKKNDPITNPPIEKPDPLELLGDSASFTFEGKSISVNNVNSFSRFNLQSNSKIDSIVKGVKYISGDKDSTMYGQDYSIHDKDYDNSITVTFAKKFNKNNMNNNNLWSHTPKNFLELYYTGNYPYAVDLHKENTQNGIAVSLKSGRQSYKSSGPDYFSNEPTTIKKDAQKDSKFEVTKLTKLKSGLYLLEAKFSLTVFGEAETPKKLENGYLRIRINTL